MLRRQYTVISAVLTLAFLNAGPAEGEVLKPTTNYMEIARLVAVSLPREHLNHHPMDDVISSMAWTNYLFSAGGLDYNRVYFLKSDIKK